MQINNMTFTSYDNLNENEKINLSILQMISKELLTNDFYKYDDIYESAYGLLNYVKDIKNGYVNNKYYFKYVSLLVEHLSFRYDKFEDGVISNVSEVKRKMIELLKINSMNKGKNN